MNDQREEKTPRKEVFNQLHSFYHHTIWFTFIAISLNLLSNVVAMAQTLTEVRH